MEALIVIFVVFALINSLAQKAKKANEENANHPTAKTQSHHHAKPQPTKAKPMVRTNETRTTPIQPRHYETIQPMVTDTNSLNGYVGSLGVSSSEGADSSEGKDLCDASLGHGRPERITLSDDVGTEQNVACPDFLPEHYDGNELVRAVVMSEILTRSQQRWERHTRG